MTAQAEETAPAQYLQPNPRDADDRPRKSRKKATSKGWLRSKRSRRTRTRSTLKGWLQSRRRFFAGTTAVFGATSLAAFVALWLPWSNFDELWAGDIGAPAIVTLVAGSLALAGTIIVVWSAGLVYLAMTPQGPMAELADKADTEPANCLALFPSEHAVLEEFDLAERTLTSLRERDRLPETDPAVTAAKKKVDLLSRRVQMLVLEKVFNELRVTFERELRRTLVGAGIAVIGFWWYGVLLFT